MATWKRLFNRAFYRFRRVRLYCQDCGKRSMILRNPMICEAETLDAEGRG